MICYQLSNVAICRNNAVVPKIECIVPTGDLLCALVRTVPSHFSNEFYTVLELWVISHFRKIMQANSTKIEKIGKNVRVSPSHFLMRDSVRDS